MLITYSNASLLAMRNAAQHGDKTRLKRTKQIIGRAIAAQHARDHLAAAVRQAQLHYSHREG